MGRVEQAVQKDCCLIFEAMRRLIDGTCCLRDEEKVCVWDLFHKLNEAFTEHVEFEEHWVLPRLPEAERTRHHLEHQKLRGLFEKARWEFECAEGDRFRGIMIELVRELKAHHERDPELPQDLELPGDRDILRITDRATHGVLD